MPWCMVKSSPSAYFSNETLIPQHLGVLADSSHRSTSIRVTGTFRGSELAWPRLCVFSECRPLIRKATPVELLWVQLRSMLHFSSTLRSDQFCFPHTLTGIVPDMIALTNKSLAHNSIVSFLYAS